MNLNPLPKIIGRLSWVLKRSNKNSVEEMSGEEAGPEPSSSSSASSLSSSQRPAKDPESAGSLSELTTSSSDDDDEDTFGTEPKKIKSAAAKVKKRSLTITVADKLKETPDSKGINPLKKQISMPETKKLNWSSSSGSGQ